MGLQEPGPQMWICFLDTVQMKRTIKLILPDIHTHTLYNTDMLKIVYSWKKGQYCGQLHDKKL